jgi:hypothetical protein
MPSVRTVAVLCVALTARCVFGRMSWLASTGLFENPDPTRFQQHAGSWMLAMMVVPALTVGIGICRRVILCAIAVELIAALILGLWNDYGLVPDGSFLPEPPILLLAVIEDTVVGMLLAAILAFCVHYGKCKISARVGHGIKET